MDYVEDGIFELDMDNLPSIKILPRAISSKSAEVEIFIKSDSIYVYARDLAGNVNYIAQEKGKRIKMYDKDNFGGVSYSKGNDEVDELAGINDSDIDELGSMLNDLLGDADSVINDTEDPHDKLWADFDVSPDTEVEGTTMPEMNMEMTGSDLNDTVEEKYCRFSTSADLLKIFNMYKRVRINVMEKEIIVESLEDLTKVRFARTRSYTEIDKIEELTKGLEWETFPTENVKSIVPAIEKIEPLRYKQTLSILGDKLYTFSDTIAVETSTGALSRNYLLNNEVMRILKYSVGKTTEVMISKTPQGGVALNVDNLIIIFGEMHQPTSNLFDLTRGTLKLEPFISSINKKFIDKITMAHNIFKNYTEITIETKDDVVIISNERMETVHVPEKRVSNGKKIKLDIEKLILAIRITGTTTPSLSLFKMKGNKAVLVLEGTVRVLIDVNEYVEIS